MYSIIRCFIIYVMKVESLSPELIQFKKELDAKHIELEKEYNLKMLSTIKEYCNAFNLYAFSAYNNAINESK